jgi:signal transduction histidine kinase
MTRPRTASMLALGCLCAAVAVWLLGAVLLLEYPAPAQAENYGTLYGDLVLSVAALSFALVGYFLVRRLAGNVLGWLLLGCGLAVQVFGTADQYHSIADPPAPWAGAVSTRAGVVFGGLLLVAIPWLFPTGRPLSARWSQVGWAATGLVAFVFVLPQAGLVFVVPGALAVASLVARYRRGDAAVRAQVRWLAWASTAVLGSLIGLAVLGHLLGHPTPMWFRFTNDAANLAIAAIPIGIAVAVLRYRLWAIDVIADRTLVVLGVAAFTSAMYVAVVIGVGSLIGARGNIWLLIAATVLVAVTVQPARRWVGVAVHRLVFGDRPDPYQILTEFSHRVAQSYLGTDALLACARAAAVATRAPAAHAWIQVVGGWQCVASWPATAGHPDQAGAPINLDSGAYALVEHHGTVLGALSVDTHGDLSADEQRVLRDLATQATMLFRNVALDADLRERLVQLAAQAEELRQSRQRILVAEDAARRQIERDLHDGAQQRLVTLGVSLQRLRTRVAGDPSALPLLDMASGDLRQALRELRELARGIHPTLLTESGLAEALGALIERSPVNATLDHVPMRRYPAPIETTVYYVVAEALTNVAKHAPTASVRVAVTEHDHHLRARIVDDGPGGANATRGSGLRGLDDRVGSAGGSLTVSSSTGTEILAELPCD